MGNEPVKRTLSVAPGVDISGCFLFSGADVQCHERVMRKPLVAVDMSEIASIDHLHQVLSKELDFPG